jgi:hypothetical protein
MEGFILLFSKVLYQQNNNKTTVETTPPNSTLFILFCYLKGSHNIYHMMNHYKFSFGKVTH